ncbi:MAG: DUF1573 domain-containing protein [Flavobacteriales bacterium]|jgi:Mg-chelatase subunit ChlD|nr:DUF1573 domain-containing protein [Flavobacteriales bacterium]
MRLFLFILILVQLPFGLWAQNVRWETTTVNFGSIGDWNSPPATFKFTNSGNERLMFLPQHHDREVLVRYPNRAIQPGETGEIEILYYTSQTGSFSRTVEVYSNASNKAEKLTMKGNIRSIYANALTACPSFHETAPVRSSEPNVVQVVDAATNRPIPNASVEIYDRGIRKAINGTNLDGVAVNWIEPDKYIAVASKEGYEKAEQEIVFTKRDRTQVIYLNRKSLEPEFNEEEIIASVDNRWEEPKEVSDERFETPESEHLGVTTNVLLEEESARPLEEIDTSTSLSASLGITTNEVLAEEVFEVSDDRFQISEEPAEESFDFGITTNDQLDEENRQSIIDNRSSPIEEEVEAALAKAESAPIEKEIAVEPEPEFSTEKYRPNNVLLLLDVSGSMNDEGKMDKLKSSIRRLVMMLRGEDVLTMIAYNSDSWVLLPPTPVADNQPILELVDSLRPYGYTNGVKGMETAYESLETQLIEGGNNQLIIATDGKFNSSKFSENEAVQMVKDNSDKGIVLSIIGFGEDKEAGRLMKKLADLGEGSFLQVRDNEDPTELLAEEIKLRSLK